MNFDNRWQRDHARRTWNRPRFKPRRRRTALIATAVAGILGGLGWVAFPLVLGEARAVPDAPAALFGRPAIRFTMCHSGGGTNCVVDGDTFRMSGEKIRIADIDTPETHPARCAREAELGKAATHRLHALLNSGTVSLVAATASPVSAASPITAPVLTFFMFPLRH